MVSGAGKLALGLTAVLGAGLVTFLGISALIRAKSTSCPSGDVAANADGTCPSGYVADPNASGCCMSSGTGVALIFQISGQVGSIAFACPCDNLSPDIVLQVAGATPNGQVAFKIGTDPNSLLPLMDEGAYVTDVADAYGEVSDPRYTCRLGNLQASGCLSGNGSPCITLCPPCTSFPCAGVGQAGSKIYLAAYDVTTGALSNVITLNPVCASPGCSPVSCCAEIA